MDKQIKAQWVTALTSGEYQQGRSALRKIDDTYCCLGVLCDLYAKAVGVEWVNNDDLDNDTAAYSIDDASAYPPGAVARWAGMDDEERRGVFYAQDVHYSLAHINDGGAHTFKDIAELIEKHF